MIINNIYCAALVIYFLVLAGQAYRYKSVLTFGRKNHHIVLIFMGVLLAILIAFRPLDISDARPYYNRYYIEAVQTTISDILYDGSFYRGTGYSMSKPVNLLFYLFYQIHFSYQFFVLTIVMTEIAVFFIFVQKMMDEINIDYNSYTLLAMLMLFYSTRYQFIAFAQGISMCLAMPILYYLLKKRYIKTSILIFIAGCIHIAALFFVVIALIYVLTIRMKTRNYVLIWMLSGFIEFTGLGFKLGGKVMGIAEYFIERIVASNPVYVTYSGGEGTYTLSVTNMLFWVLCGALILVYCKHEMYWKLLNINIISIFIGSIFGRWGIVHRFTDISKMFIPLVIILYLYEAKPILFLSSRYNKVMVILSVLGLGFLHGLSLLGFVQL